MISIISLFGQFDCKVACEEDNVPSGFLQSSTLLVQRLFIALFSISIFRIEFGYKRGRVKVRFIGDRFARF